MGFNCLKAAEPLGEDSLLFITNKYLLLMQPFAIFTVKITELKSLIIF